MTPNDSHRQAQIASLARQTGFSVDAVASMLDAIVAGGGRMAQFDHREFGGSGQWMHGGMLMISDLNDHALRERIARLCDALAAWVANDPSLAVQSSGHGGQRQTQSSGGATHTQDSRDRSPRWWPEAFGAPDATGAQDGSRYAWFAGARRLVVEHGGRRTIYDTGPHRIAGASQQQGSSAHAPTFMTESGPIDLDRLPVVGADDEHRPDGRPVASPADVHRRDDRSAATTHAAPPAQVPSSSAPVPSSTTQTPAASSDPFHALERLADLHARGIVDAHEFAAKKAELLKRI